MRNNPQYGLEAAIAGTLALGPFPVRSAKDKHHSPLFLPSAPLFILNSYFLVFHLLSLVLINVDSVSRDLFHFHVGRGEGVLTSSPSVEMVSSMSCGSWLVDVPTAWFCAWICWDPWITEVWGWFLFRSRLRNPVSSPHTTSVRLRFLRKRLFLLFPPGC